MFSAESKRKFMVGWLAFIVLTLPVYLIRFSVGIPTTFLEINIYLFFIVLVILFWKDWKSIWAEYKSVVLRWIWPVLLILVGAVVGLVSAGDKRAALGLFKAYFIDPILVLVGILVVVRDGKDMRRIFEALGLVVIGAGVVAVLQYFGVMKAAEPWAGESVKRYNSFFEYPNAVALFCAPIVGLFMGLLVRGKNLDKREKIYAWLIVLFGVAAVFLSMARGAILALLMVGFVMALFSDKRKYVLLAVGLALAGIVAFVPVRERFASIFSGKDFSTNTRVILWKSAGLMVKDNPVSGVGLGDFPEEYTKIAERDINYPIYLNEHLYPHNIFLEFWVEIGLFGLVGLIWVVSRFYVDFRRFWRHLEGNIHGYAAGLMAGLAVLVVYGLVENPYFKNDLAVLFWVIIGLGLVLFRGFYGKEKAK